MANPVVFRLSSLDQSSVRVYIRYALCYPCGSDDDSIKLITTKIRAAFKRGVSYMPILAGTVHLMPGSDSDSDPSSTDSADGVSARRHTVGDHPFSQLPNAVVRRLTVVENTNDQQRGRVEVRVSVDDVLAFEPIIKTPGKDVFPHGYAELSEAGMPPNAFIGDAFAPLPDRPEDGGPVFAMQANFIEGGVIVAMYMHHSVIGVHGLNILMRCMSINSLEERENSEEDLEEDAVDQKRVRDRLCGSRGAPASLYEHPVYNSLTHPANGIAPLTGKGACRVFTFSLKALNGLCEMVNNNFSVMQNSPETHVTPFHCLLAIIWKAITRARWPIGRATTPGQTSALVTPINIRQRVEPTLDATYYGNSDILSYTKSTILTLGQPFSPALICRAAKEIRNSFLSINDHKVRSAIAIINEAEDVRSVTTPCIDFESDVFISNWTDLPIDYDTTMALGLGPAQWTRKVSKEHSSYDCVLLPLNNKYAWEVVIQLSEPEMWRLREDPGLERFLFNQGA